MFSLHNIINKLKIFIAKNYFYEKDIIKYIFSFRPMFRLGVLHHLKRTFNDYPNIFLWIYEAFGELKAYYYRAALFALYRHHFLLLDGPKMYLTYGEYLIVNNFSDLTWRSDVNKELVLEKVYNNIYKNYVKKYGYNNKLSFFRKIYWYFKLIRVICSSLYRTYRSVVFRSNYPRIMLKYNLNILPRAFVQFIKFWIVWRHCIDEKIKLFYILHFRSFEDLILKYHFVSGDRSLVKIKNNSMLYLAALKLYNTIKTIILPLIVSLIMIFLLINFFKIEIYTNLGIWGVLGFFFLWLMSGFNFFVKRYKNGKFTGAVQRFWKRTNSYFWIVEGFLFMLFFYYYLNSSQEPLYMYDESNFNQTFLPNITVFYFSILLLLFIIFYSYYLLLNISNFSFKQQLTHLLINSVLMIYIFLLESYQFYYLINTFFEITWDYAENIKTWVLETENPKIRVKTQYLMLALIAKYWHFIFIFFSWLFLLYKSYEKKRIYYSLFGFVIQNCIILLLLNLLFCVQWLKWLIRRYYDVIYYWFFTDSNNWVLNDFTECFIGLLGF